MKLYCAIEVAAWDRADPITTLPEAIVVANGWAVCAHHTTVAYAGSPAAAAELAVQRLYQDRATTRRDAT
jgi:hypothetical protein